MASSGAGRGNVPGSVPPMRPNITQQQQAEMIRKNRKCVSCGNTAMQKCDFRACGTCCTRNRNPCPVHGLKQSATAGAATIPETQLRPQYQWTAAAPRMGMMPGYMRPPNGHVPSPYMNPAMMGYRVPYASPVVRMPTPPPVETEAEKEARLEKAKKAFIRQQREAIMVNSWRVNKMKAYADAELSFEDEAFDRYMRSAGLLDEVAGVDADILSEGEGFSAECVTDDERLLDAAMARHESKHKEQQRQKLQKAITKSFQKLRKRDGDADSVLEREFNQVGFGRRDTKRMKVQTADGKECLRRINAWEDLFQSIGSFSDVGDVRLLLDMYKKNFGRDLGTSVPHLLRKVAAPADKTEERGKGPLKDFVAVTALEQPSTTSTSETRVTEQIRIPVTERHEAVKNTQEAVMGQQEAEDQQEAAKQLDETIDKQDAAKQTDEVTDQQHFEVTDSAKPTHEALDPAKQIDEATDMDQLVETKELEPAEEALVHEEAGLHSDEGLAAAMQIDEALDEQGEAKEQEQIAEIVAQDQQDAAIHSDEILDQQQEAATQNVEEAVDEQQETAVPSVGKALDQQQETGAPNFGKALDQQEVRSVQEALCQQQEAVFRIDGAPDQQEAVVPSRDDLDKAAALEQEAENWLANAPRLPVRRLVMNLIKQKPLKVADFCKVDLDEQSLRRVFDNHHRYYTLETLE